MPACVGLATLESGDRVVRIVMNPWWSRKAYDFPSGPNGAKRIGMALHFPNASRSYDATRHCVSFWGYDSAFEIAFHLEEKALQQISRETRADEASLLQAFDVNRERIERAAGKAYSRQRKNFHRLSTADF